MIDQDTTDVMHELLLCLLSSNILMQKLSIYDKKFTFSGLQIFPVNVDFF